MSSSILGKCSRLISDRQRVQIPASPTIKRRKLLNKKKRDRLIEENMWVVDHVIKDYRHLMQYNDLKSAGLYGLIQGIEKYREGKGTKPSTYARHWVKAEVLKSLYENRNVHIPWNRINDYIKEKNEEGMFSSVSGHRDLAVIAYDAEQKNITV